MSWREQLQPASFRGAPFLVASGDATLGRRAVQHVYPNRERPMVEDLGGVGGQFSIEAILIGDDLFAKRQALFDALNQPGPGVLVHPRLGAITVQVGECRWTHETSSRERVTIPCFDPGENRQPSASVDTSALVDRQANATRDAAIDSFDERFETTGWPAYVAEEAVALWTSGLSGLRGVMGTASAGGQQLADLSWAIDNTLRDIGNLVDTPRALASQASGLVHQVMGLDSRVNQLMAGYRGLNTLLNRPEPIPQTTLARRQQLNNQAQSQQLLSTLALAEAARRIAEESANVDVASNSDSPFASADEAADVRNELIADINALALTASDLLYRELMALRSAITRHIKAHGNTLPRVRTVRFNNTLPALVIAHQVFGDARLEADIVTRNRIAQPLFVRAGTALEVLNG